MSDSEVTEVPDGWTTTRLDQIGTWSTGGTPSRKNPEYFGDGIPWVKSGDLSDGIVARTEEAITQRGLDSSAAKLLPAGSLMIALYGATIGKLGILGMEAATNQACAGCQVNPNIAQPWFVFHYLHSQRQELIKAGQGGAQPNLTNAIVREWPIPLPPLAEQRRIVERVETLLARVQAAQQRLARVPLLLKRFRQAILNAACNGELTADWRDGVGRDETGAALAARITSERARRLRELEVMPPKHRPVALSEFDNLEPELRGDLALPDIPAEWLWVDLRFLMSPEESFCYGVVQPGIDDESGPRLIRVCDIERGTVTVETCRGITQDVHDQYSRSILRGGEVLVSVVGTIGRSAVAPPTTQGFNIARAVAKVPIREFAGRFVNYWLCSSLAQDWMIDDAREVARKTLNLEQLRTLPCPLPPLAEQHEIVRRVDALFKLADAIELHVAAATARAEKLTQAILAKAFRGELVPTEAALARAAGREYETAEQLLARVAATAQERPQRTRQPRVIDIRMEHTLSISQDFTMRPLDRDSVLSAIAQLKAAEFTFDDLRNTIPGDYEELKQVVFELLQAPDASLVQRFDESSEQMMFARRTK